MGIPPTFPALLVEEYPSGEFTRRVVQRTLADLPPGDLLVRVDYSSLNYKDALSASGHRGVTRFYPHVPGIDAAGEVIESASDRFQPGDLVSIFSKEFGASVPGGYSRYIRAPAAWAVRLPPALTPERAMAYGTGGFTAALCIRKLQAHGIVPASGEVLVTGATGGVGAFAAVLLARLGYTVVAATGKPDRAGYLLERGISRVVPREEVDDHSGKPLLSSHWAGVVDSVGGSYLSTAIRATRPGGAVAACGNAASPELNLTVFPFILRGVSLLGVDSTLLTAGERAEVWQQIAGDWMLPELEKLYRVVGLEDLNAEIERILKGEQVGRVVIRLHP